MTTKSEGMEIWMKLQDGLMWNLMNWFVDTIEDCPKGMTIGEHLAKVLEHEAARLRGRK